MNKSELIKALKDVSEDAEILVIDIFYDETVCHDVIKFVPCSDDHIEIYDNEVRLGAY